MRGGGQWFTHKILFQSRLPKAVVSEDLSDSEEYRTCQSGMEVVDSKGLAEKKQKHETVFPLRLLP